MKCSYSIAEPEFLEEIHTRYEENSKALAGIQTQNLLAVAPTHGFVSYQQKSTRTKNLSQKNMTKRDRLTSGFLVFFFEEG